MALTRSITALQETIDSRIAQESLDAALRLIHQTVDLVLCEPINTANIYGSRLLDEYCQKVGAINLQRLRDSMQPVPVDDEPISTVVYVASCIFASGGHSAVLADMIRLAPPARNIILITNTTEVTRLAAIQHHFAGLAQVTCMCAPRGTHLEKLDWLQRKLLELNPDTVWLFNHPQDSVAVAAVQPDTGYQLRYYHHGDHHLSLGVFLDYADHIDPHPMGFHHCRSELGIQRNRYLPLTVRDQGDRPIGEDRLPGCGLVSCTAASSGKIEADYFIRYADVIPQMLHASGGRHIHIGPLRQLTLLRIRRKLRKLGLPEDCFMHIPYVRSVWQALHEHQVDLYVSSFPYGGGRTLIEAMGAGVAVAIHQHCHSRILSPADMAFGSAMLWRNPQELYSYVNRADPETLRRQGQTARKKYLECYREEVLSSALSNWRQPLPPPPPLGKFTPDELQLALDITNQVSCIGTLKRLLCRLKRRWRALNT